MKIAIILAVITLVTLSFYSAQSAPKTLEEPILLKSRYIMPVYGLTTSAEISGTHVLIQLDHIPSNVEKKDLASQGILLLDYIPNNAWIASVGSKGTSALSQNTKVTYIGPILPQDKISPVLSYAEWARNSDGTMNAYVLFYPDVSEEKAEDLVKEIVVERAEYNIYLVEIDENEIYGLASKDEVKWIEPIPPPPLALNDGSRASIGVDTINSPPYNLNGTGVVVAEWDEGWAEQTHSGLTGRVTRGDTGNSDILHSTHVAGTVLGNGAGGNELYRGMAPNATLITYEWWDDLTELNDEYTTAINTHSAVISQNSWGILDRLGACSLLGDYYGIETPRIDNVTRGVLGDKILTVWAAGNEREAGTCGPQLGVEYNTTIPYSTAKNALTVGAVNSNDNSMTAFTSWGPTDDGRLKPDIMAAGCEDDLNRNDANPAKTIWSTKLSNTYGGLCGTSMAAPAVSGAAALIYEDWRNQFGGSDPFPSTVKALIIHTALDLSDTGPDFRTGYGLVNATKAIQKLRDDATMNVIVEGNVSSGENDTFQLTISGESEIKFTLVWDDFPGAAQANPALVNNLDLIVMNSSGTRFYPWTLDPSNPSAPAVQTSADNLNNVEQVVVTSPNNGTWTIIVNGTSVPQAPQNYSLISSNSFNPDITFVPPTPDNGSILDNNFAFINVTISEPASSVLLEWNLTNETMSNSSQTNWFLNKTGLYDSNYTYRVHATDLAGLKNTTKYRTLEIYLISIETPLNRSYNTTNLDFNITVNRTLNNALFSADDGVNNTMGNDTLVHFFNTSFTVSGEGLHNATFWVNDTQNESNTRTIYYTIDLTAPNWSNNSTSLVTTYDPSNLSFFNITWMDNLQIDTAWIEGNWSPFNFSMFSQDSSVYQYNTSLPVGTFFWRSWANDSAGNLNVSDNHIFTVSKLATNTTLFLNGTNSNQTFEIGDLINLTATLNTTGNVSIYRNGTSIANGSAPLEFLWNTTHITLGIYNITARFEGATNHTPSLHSLNLTLNDTVSPNIGTPALFPPLIIAGEPVSVSAIINDLGFLSETFLNVSNASFYSTQAMSNVSDLYNVSFDTSNLTVGLYIAVVTSNDTKGNRANLSAGTFEISQDTSLDIDILSNVNSSTNVSRIEIFYNGTNSVRNSSSDNASGLVGSLPRGIWDIKISTDELNFTIKANISGNTTANISVDDNITESSINLPSGFTKFTKTVALETTLNFSTTSVVILYNESDINETHINVLACHTWSLSSRTCPGDSWANVTSSSAIDTAGNKVTVSATQLSGFSVSQPVFCGDSICSSSETCSACSQDCGACSNTNDDTNSNGPGGSGPPADDSSLCTSGELSCSGNDLRECNSDGSAWVVLETCQHGCSNEACNAAPVVCVPGEKKCSGDTVVQCNQNGTFFTIAQTCESGCTNGACNSPASQFCQPDMIRCSGDILEKCNSEGSEYDLIEVCEFGCSESACNTQPGQGTALLLPLGIAVVIIVVVMVFFMLRVTKGNVFIHS